MNSLKKQTINALSWDIVGSLASKGSGFVISIFLARILSPEDFGLVGMVMVFVTFSSVLLDVGLGSALIQRQEVDKRDYSSVLILNAVMGSILSFSFYLSSDYIGQFYENDTIPKLCKVLSGIFLINSIGVIPKTFLTKRLEFKSLAKISVIASVSSGLIGIGMALQGYGVWSITVQLLLGAFVNVILLWRQVPGGFPGLTFDWDRIKSLWTFGFHIFASSFLNNILIKLDVFLIGKLFTPALLGYYTRAQSVTNLVNTYSGKSAMKVLFPALSKIQDNKNKLISVYQKGLKLISFVSFSLTAFLYITSPSWFLLLFGVKWADSVPILKIMLIRSFVPPLSALSINMLKAKGHGKLFLISEVLKKVLFIGAIVLGFQFGITEFLYAFIIQGLLGLIINFMFISKILEITTYQQIKIIIPYASYAAVLVLGITFILSKMNLSLLQELAFTTVTFLLVVLTVLKYTKNDIYPMIQKGFKMYFA